HLWRHRSLLVADDPWTDPATAPIAPATARAVLCSRNGLLIRLVSTQASPTGGQQALRLRWLTRELPAAASSTACAELPHPAGPPLLDAAARLVGTYLLLSNRGTSGNTGNGAVGTVLVRL
ncbi:hypothetical protein PybrP1_006346, partial [[Pythium] brassicae (nom. inval.)]